jgi:protein arginine N-methyltransferase 1
MYRLSDYRAMVLDEVRTSAYARALEAAVRPGMTVVELGTGFGYFAVAACRAGARQVHAIDPDPVIHLGPELARANGFEDRIHFIQNVSTRVTLEPADVLVSDLRGTLPLLGHHIPAIVDARTRLLRPGGVQIPARDTIWLALASPPPSEPPPTTSGRNGIDLAPVERALTHLWASARLEVGDLFSSPAAWAVIDYRAVTSPDLDGTVELTAERAGVVRGIGAWFSTELLDGCGFSTAPGGPRHVYGHAFFPLPSPMALAQGDTVRVRVRANLVGSDYVWSWDGCVLDGAQRNAFAQSTFHAAPLSAARLRRRADRFTPRLGRHGQGPGVDPGPDVGIGLPRGDRARRARGLPRHPDRLRGRAPPRGRSLGGARRVRGR